MMKINPLSSQDTPTQMLSGDVSHALN